MTARRIEPPPTGIVFPDPRDAVEGIVAVGTDFRPGTLLTAYRSGIFPWPHGKTNKQVLWFSPEERMIYPLDGSAEPSRRMRATLRSHPYRITTNQAFIEVAKACGNERDQGTWITPELLAGYAQLHELGWAESLEVWDERGTERALIGGIYGVSIGGLFAGESMFHRVKDASKIAFYEMAKRLSARGFMVFDAQVYNDHLDSLGCYEIPRDEYLSRLQAALAIEVKPDVTPDLA
jgi:leucyl/phenylalanyl-tRNA--protein transferase